MGEFEIMYEDECWCFEDGCKCGNPDEDCICVCTCGEDE